MTPFRDFARSKRPKLFSRGFWTRATAGASMCMIQLFGSGALYTQKGDKITSASPTLLSLPLIVSLFLVFCKPKEEGRQAGRQARVSSAHRRRQGVVSKGQLYPTDWLSLATPPHLQVVGCGNQGWDTDDDGAVGSRGGSQRLACRDCGKWIRRWSQLVV